MSSNFWLKQTKDQPLFPDLIWSRPENQRLAGKLAIIGGSGYEFKAPANAYGDALAAGVGVAKVLLPASMQKTVEAIFPEAEFAPSTHSGSFASSALAQLLDLAEWADGVLLAGDIGRNSETAIMLERFLAKYSGLLILAGDSLDGFLARPGTLLNRADTTAVVSFAQLQKLASAARLDQAITSQLELLRLVEMLHDFSTSISASLLTIFEDQIIVASAGQVSATKLETAGSLASLAASAAVWQLQNPKQVFKALTTAVIAQ